MKHEPKDLPSFKNAAQYIPSFKLFLKGRKFFSFFGIGKEKTQELEEQLNSLIEQLEDLKTYPTKYNQYFASEGWIAHDSINSEIIKNAVDAYENYGMDEANKIIMDFYKPANVKNHIFLLRWIPEFQSRYKFIEYALNDYKEGRYYSCIPLLIMMIDGMVNDAIQKGFHANNIDLNVWDSLTATDTGIMELKRIFQTSRKKTTDEPITLPYRHGILHGRDLGYDNSELAAKCWSFLFVIRDWIISKNSESSRIEKHNQENKKISWRELFGQIQETNDMKKALAAWKPRDIPEYYLTKINSTQEAQEDSPEEMVRSFLQYWQANNYGKMANLFSKLIVDNPKKYAGEIRQEYSDLILNSYEITAIRDEAASITEVDVIISIGDKGEEQRDFKFRCIYEKGRKKPAVRGMEDGEWKIVWCR